MTNGHLARIGLEVAALHAVAGTSIPLFTVCLLTRFFGENRSFADGLAVAPHALYSAFAMTIPDVVVKIRHGSRAGARPFATVDPGRRRLFAGGPATAGPDRW